MESTSETTTAGYVLPSDGSLGGIIVTRRPFACDGTFDVTETDEGAAPKIIRADSTRTKTASFLLN